MKFCILLVIQISTIITIKKNQCRALKQKLKQIYQQYNDDFQKSQVQNSQIGDYQRSDPSVMVYDYNQKQRLKDSQYFFQPAYFNPLTKINDQKYKVNLTQQMPFVFKNPFLDQKHYTQYGTPPPLAPNEQSIVLGTLPSYNDIMQQYNQQQSNCTCSNPNIICDCDEVVCLTLNLTTIVLPMLQPMMDVHQKPKVIHNVNRVGVETNYNQLNQLKVNHYVDGQLQGVNTTKCIPKDNQLRFKQIYLHQYNQQRGSKVFRFKQLFDQLKNEKKIMTREERDKCDKLLSEQETVDLHNYVPPVKIITKIKDIENLRDFNSKHKNYQLVTVIPRKVLQRIVPRHIYEQKMQHYVEDETFTSVLNQAWDNTKMDAIKKNLYSSCKTKTFEQKIQTK